MVGAAAFLLRVLWLSPRAHYLPPSDDALHLASAGLLLRNFQGSSLLPGLIQSYFFSTHNPYPPLVYWWAAVAAPWWGGSWSKAALDSSQFFWIPLALGTWYLGFRTAGPVGAVTAMLLSLSSPLLLFCASQFMLDFPLTAITACALAFLVASEGFRRRTPSLLFGLLAGLALMTKWSALIFLLPPFAVALLGGRRWTPRSAALAGLGAVSGLAALACLAWVSLQIGFAPALQLTGGAVLLLALAGFGCAGERPRLGHALLALAVILLTAVPWYAAFANLLANLLGEAATGPTKLVRFDSAWDGYLWVCKFVRDDMLVLPGVLLLALGLTRLRRIPAGGEILAAFVPPLLILGYWPNFTFRYCLPLVVAGSVLATAGAESLPGRWPRLAHRVVMVASALMIAGWLLPGPVRGTLKAGWDTILPHPALTLDTHDTMANPQDLRWLAWEPEPPWGPDSPPDEPSWKKVDRLLDHLEALAQPRPKGTRQLLVVAWPAPRWVLTDWLNFLGTERGIPLFVYPGPPEFGPDYVLEASPPGTPLQVEDEVLYLRKHERIDNPGWRGS